MRCGLGLARKLLAYFNPGKEPRGPKYERALRELAAQNATTLDPLAIEAIMAVAEGDEFA